MHDTQPPSFAELKLLSDGELMAHLQTGCNDALAILFDRYHRLVLSIALKIVRDSGEAEDVMQSVFLEIFRSVAQFGWERPLRRAERTVRGWRPTVGTVHGQAAFLRDESLCRCAAGSMKQWFGISAVSLASCSPCFF
jgi:hypothetical protein